MKKQKYFFIVVLLLISFMLAITLTACNKDKHDDSTGGGDNTAVPLNTDALKTSIFKLLDIEGSFEEVLIDSRGSVQVALVFSSTDNICEGIKASSLTQAKVDNLTAIFNDPYDINGIDDLYKKFAAKGFTKNEVSLFTEILFEAIYSAFNDDDLLAQCIPVCEAYIADFDSPDKEIVLQYVKYRKAEEDLRIIYGKYEEGDTISAEDFAAGQAILTGCELADKLADYADSDSREKFYNGIVNVACVAKNNAEDELDNNEIRKAAHEKYNQSSNFYGFFNAYRNSGYAGNTDTLAWISDWLDYYKAINTQSALTLPSAISGVDKTWLINAYREVRAFDNTQYDIANDYNNYWYITDNLNDMKSSSLLELTDMSFIKDDVFYSKSKAVIGDLGGYLYTLLATNHNMYESPLMDVQNIDEVNAADIIALGGSYLDSLDEFCAFIETNKADLSALATFFLDGCLEPDYQEASGILGNLGTMIENAVALAPIVQPLLNTVVTDITQEIAAGILDNSAEDGINANLAIYIAKFAADFKTAYPTADSLQAVLIDIFDDSTSEPNTIYGQNLFGYALELLGGLAPEYSLTQAEEDSIDDYFGLAGLYEEYIGAYNEDEREDSYDGIIAVFGDDIEYRLPDGGSFADETNIRAFASEVKELLAAHKTEVRDILNDMLDTLLDTVYTDFLDNDLAALAAASAVTTNEGTAYQSLITLIFNTANGLFEDISDVEPFMSELAIFFASVFDNSADAPEVVLAPGTDYNIALDAGKYEKTVVFVITPTVTGTFYSRELPSDIGYNGFTFANGEEAAWANSNSSNSNTIISTYSNLYAGLTVKLEVTFYEDCVFSYSINELDFDD